MLRGLNGSGIRAELTRFLGWLGSFERTRAVVGRVLRWIVLVKWSAVAFGLAGCLNFLSLGLLGYLLYFPVSPVLLLRFAPASQWTGDWVWPTILLAGLLWSPGFLLAGEVNRRRLDRQTRPLRRRLVYLGVLWGWDSLTWFLALSFPSN